MSEPVKYSEAKIRSIIFTDLVFRSPLWALLILLIYGIIMGGAIWFIANVIKPSVDRKMNKHKTSEGIRIKSERVGSKDVDYGNYVETERREQIY